MSSIPKCIHYCWFGGNPLGLDEERCIASWREHFPEYEIRRWDESNFDVRCCPYVSEAYEAKKWAFVSDYARFKILFDEGGLYFDTDVEVIRPLDDIIDQGPFMGCETDVGMSAAHGKAVNVAVNPGLGLASPPGSALYGEVLESYEEDHFLSSDGRMNLTTVVERMTAILRERGLLNRPGIQDVGGIRVYPSEYFCPMDMYTGELNVTHNTRTIHHYKASWHIASQKTEDHIRRSLLSRGINPTVAHHIARLAAILRHLDFERVIGKIKRAVLHE